MRLLVLCDVLFPLVPSLVRDESEDVDPDNVEEETLLLVQPAGEAGSITMTLTYSRHTEISAYTRYIYIYHTLTHTNHTMHCMYICTCMHPHTRTHTHLTYRHKTHLTHTLTHIHTHTHTQVHTNTHTPTPTPTLKYTQTCTHPHPHPHSSTHKHAHTHTHTHTQVHTNTHTHTHLYMVLKVFVGEELVQCWTAHCSRQHGPLLADLYIQCNEFTDEGDCKVTQR